MSLQRLPTFAWDNCKLSKSKSSQPRGTRRWAGGTPCTKSCEAWDSPAATPITASSCTLRAGARRDKERVEWKWRGEREGKGYAIDEVANERATIERGSHCSNLKSAKSAKVADDARARHRCSQFSLTPSRWMDCNRNCGCGDSRHPATLRFVGLAIREMDGV